MTSRIVVDEDDPTDDVDDPPFEYREVPIRKDKWVKDEFEILDFLGRGKFGEVKRCRELATDREFAAKFICAPRAQDKKDVEHEVDIMKKLQHKRLIQLYDAFESKSEMCLVLEIIYGGELFDRVISEDFILTEKACVAFVRQICEGLEYMHGKRIIHLDMKPENILCLTRTGNRIKIIDFGLAREFHPKKDLRVLFGTPEFMAPEVVQYEPINFGTDMWSVGVICYVLLSGLSPFMGDTDADTLSNVIKCQFDYNYAEFEEVSDEAKDLISNLLVKEKTKRLTAAQCLAHPWLQKPAPDSPGASLQLTKRRLKRFVYRRKWQKIVNAIIALRRMGFQLMSIKRNSLGHIATTEEIYGRDFTDGSTSQNAQGDHASVPNALGAKAYDLNKRKPSDSGYESVAVGDKDAAKDFAPDGDIGSDPEPSTSQAGLSNDVGASESGAKSKESMKKDGASLEPPKENIEPESPSEKRKSWSSKPLLSARKSPQNEGSSSGKKSVIEKFGGLFSNNKDKDATLKKDKSTKKGTSKKTKDKSVPGGLVKKDSTKRKVGPKTKQEVYVTTPGVKKKDLFFGKDFEMNGSVVHDQDSNDLSSKKGNGDSDTNGNGAKSNGANGNGSKSSGANGGDRGAKGNGKDSDDQSANGDDNTPSILLGNVKNKMKMFEKNGR